jgi:hypothetical protein
LLRRGSTRQRAPRASSCWRILPLGTAAFKSNPPAPEARQKLASPVRAGYTKHSKPERRRCDTYAAAFLVRQPSSPSKFPFWYCLFTCNQTQFVLPFLVPIFRQSRTTSRNHRALPSVSKFPFRNFHLFFDFFTSEPCISNRYTARIEIPATPSKQTAVVLSNRYNGTPPRGVGTSSPFVPAPASAESSVSPMSQQNERDPDRQVSGRLIATPTQTEILVKPSPLKGIQFSNRDSKHAVPQLPHCPALPSNRPPRESTCRTLAW